MLIFTLAYTMRSAHRTQAWRRERGRGGEGRRESKWKEYIQRGLGAMRERLREREREVETDRERKREEPILTTTRITANQEKKTVSFESRQSTFTHTTAQL